jgi:hypothetical protein
MAAHGIFMRIIAATKISTTNCGNFPHENTPSGFFSDYAAIFRNWPFIVSRPERAYLELLDELPDHDTFQMADVIMEGLTNLSTRRMQSLLENRCNIKMTGLGKLALEKGR